MNLSLSSAQSLPAGCIVIDESPVLAAMIAAEVAQQAAQQAIRDAFLPLVRNCAQIRGIRGEGFIVDAGDELVGWANSFVAFKTRSTAGVSMLDFISGKLNKFATQWCKDRA